MVKPTDTDIPISFLRECFRLDASGAPVWRERPRKHFATNQAWPRWNTLYAGKVAGVPVHGYAQIEVTFEGKVRRLLSHRVAFALAHGRWPAEQVDHRDRDKSNGSLDNLREATHSQNIQNSRLYSTNKTGVKGVCWNARQRKWWAYIWDGGRGGHQRHLGFFTEFEDAVAARRAAETDWH
jgi:HNH endonuclease